MQTVLTLVLLAMMFCFDSKTDRFQCLPDGIDPKSPVQDLSQESKTKPQTLEQKLIELNAKCKKGKLVAGNGREIRLIQLVGCWGNPPEDYLEQIESQREEITRLKKTYLVIELPCAVGRDPAKIN